MPRQLETHVNWRAADVRDPKMWTMPLTPEDHRERDLALRAAKSKSFDVLQFGKDDFPLEGLAEKLRDRRHDLINGRGFVRISALDVPRYDDSDLTMLYWGSGCTSVSPGAKTNTACRNVIPKRRGFPKLSWTLFGWSVQWPTIEITVLQPAL